MNTKIETTSSRREREDRVQRGPGDSTRAEGKEMGARPFNRLRWIILGALALLLTGGVVAALAVPGVADTVKSLWSGETKSRKGADDDPQSAELWRDANNSYGLRLTEEAVKGLGIVPVAAKKATQPRPLPPQIGTLNYDNDRLFSIRSRFPGEIAEIKQVEEDTTGSPTRRPLRFGDKVKQGETLAVLWSRDLGEKKAALVDALCSLRLSRGTLARQYDIFKDGALSLAAVKASERQVQADSNAVLTAERTLKMWKLTDQEIQAIKDEAQVISDQKKVRTAENEMRWARVEIQVPRFLDAKGPSAKLNLAVVEKNTNVNDMVDPINSPPLFRVADLGRLQIWVHPPEEYLPSIRDSLKKGKKLKWQIRFQSEPPNTPPLELEIVQIAPSLEPNQHNPMVIGYLDNPEGKYLVGQFVTATIYMEPPANTVEIPTEALNEVGGEAMVFVQPDPARREYVLRRVAVVQRFKDVTFVRSELTPEEEQTSKRETERGRLPLSPLRPGERVVTRGVVEMTAALEAQKTQRRGEK
jgi:cobalt-zinc-cadmium efflux system membrane fusion protein